MKPTPRPKERGVVNQPASRKGWPTPSFDCALGPAGKAIPLDSKAVVPPSGGRTSAGISQWPFDAAFFCGNKSHALWTILSRRDSSSIALPAGRS